MSEYIHYSDIRNQSIDESDIQCINHKLNLNYYLCLRVNKLIYNLETTISSDQPDQEYLAFILHIKCCLM